MAKNKNNYSDSISGFKIAALFGFRPHYLGLCGPTQARQQKLLQKFLQGKITVAKMRPVFRKFLSAYSYYKLIARSNKIKNPFDEKVVSAYWIGNELLDKVKTGDLRQMIAKEFGGPGLLPKKIAIEKAGVIPHGSKPHHSFHVLAIGSVTGSVDFKNTKLKDLCRIGWGRVKKIKNQPRRPKGSGPRPEASEISNLVVQYQPLIGEKKIKLGKPVKKEIIWNKILAPKVKTGDWVAFHWDYLAQILTKKDVKNLRKYTLNTLNKINARSR